MALLSWNAFILDAIILVAVALSSELNAKELALSRGRRDEKRSTSASLATERMVGSLAQPSWATCKGIMQDTYSASWLTNAAFIRKLAYEPERLYKRGTNMEGASFLLFQVKGSVKVKSMDMLDMFIEHLSW